jgi:YfiH family protein
MKRNGFVIREFQGILYYSCRAFERIPQLHHGFSTRYGGISGIGRCLLNLSETSWDTPEPVRENRRRFLSALRLEKSRLVTLRQIHSNRVCAVEEIPDRCDRIEGDALVTRAKNTALAVQTADCLPVLIADPAKRAVAAVHSGWRGTLSRVLFETIRRMHLMFGCDPHRLLIAIGPGIRSCCFEVGSEVADLFAEQYPGCSLARPVKNRPGKHLLDLGRALDIQMNLAGVPPENRHDLGACTCCNTREFFSYRAEGAASGRMMAAIGMSGCAAAEEKI